ncbi:hypothetical protein FB451DRAFT_1369872 [Mycena latifolia]|nr:hypothetical protein FB451DRAFT_1369872 [Mycena latifolia]
MEVGFFTAAFDLTAGKFSALLRPNFRAPQASGHKHLHTWAQRPQALPVDTDGRLPPKHKSARQLQKEALTLCADLQVIDAGGKWISPGIVDVYAVQILALLSHSVQRAQALIREFAQKPQKPHAAFFILELETASQGVSFYNDSRQETCQSQSLSDPNTAKNNDEAPEIHSAHASPARDESPPWLGIEGSHLPSDDDSIHSDPQWPSSPEIDEDEPEGSDPRKHK